MSNTVLVALDLAHPQHHAKLLTKASQMADLDGAGIAVVSVIPDFGMSIVGSFFEAGAEEQALQDAAKALHEAVTKVLGADRDARIKHIIRHGNAYEEILETAKMVNAGLVIMGAHKPNYGDYLLGPNAARVVRHSECSVLVIRDNG